MINTAVTGTDVSGSIAVYETKVPGSADPSPPSVFFLFFFFIFLSVSFVLLFFFFFLLVPAADLFVEFRSDGLLVRQKT
jgi:hypothetical protein